MWPQNKSKEYRADVPIPPINTMATFEFIEANKNKEVEGPYMNIL